MSTAASTAPRTPESPQSSPEPASGLDRFFEITRRGSTIGAEVRGGIVTFVTMAYIVILNPIILSTPDVDGTTLPSAAVATSTALTAGVMTILFGLVTRLPFAFAAGLGINAFVAFSVVGQVSWGEAMALVYCCRVASRRESSAISSRVSTPFSVSTAIATAREAARLKNSMPRATLSDRRAPARSSASSISPTIFVLAS